MPTFLTFFSAALLALMKEQTSSSYKSYIVCVPRVFLQRRLGFTAGELEFSTRSVIQFF